MLAERILKQAMIIKSQLSEEQNKVCDMFLKESITKHDGFPLESALASLILEAKEEIAKNSAKQDGRRALYSLAKDIVKTAKRNYPRLTGSFTQERYNKSDDHQYFMDGYRLLRVKNHFDIEPIDEKQGEVPNVQDITGWNVQRMETLADVPSVADLKTYIQDKKAKGETRGGSVAYDFGEKYCYINAEWLLSAIKAFPNGKVYSQKSSVFVVYDEKADEGIVIVGMRRD